MKASLLEFISEKKQAKTLPIINRAEVNKKACNSNSILYLGFRCSNHGNKRTRFPQNIELHSTQLPTQHVAI